MKEGKPKREEEPESIGRLSSSSNRVGGSVWEGEQEGSEVSLRFVRRGRGGFFFGGTRLRLLPRVSGVSEVTVRGGDLVLRLLEIELLDCGREGKREGEGSQRETSTMAQTRKSENRNEPITPGRRLKFWLITATRSSSECLEVP